MLRLWTIAALCLSLLSCHRKALTKAADELQTPQDPQKKLEQLAWETYRADYEIIYNPSQTAALVRKSVRPGVRSIYPTVYFFIYDLAAQEKIYEDVVVNAEYVRWVGDQEVAVLSVPGQVEDPQARSNPSGYIYNVAERTKRLSGKN